MAFFNKFPYTDYHELNLDWILTKLGLIDKGIKESADSAKLAKEAQEGAETARNGAESARAGARTAERNTIELYNNLGGTVAPQVTEWLNDNVNPVGSAVVVDDSLSISGAAADAEATGNEINNLKNDLNYNHTAVAGYVLRATNNGNGNEWALVGTPTDAQAEAAVSDWLDAHPEATTTVQDESLSYKKLIPGTLGYITPEMFGAVGDGVTDDTNAVQTAVALGGNIFVENKYLITDIIYYNRPINVFGNGEFKVTSGKPLFFASSGATVDGIHFNGFSVIGDGSTYTEISGSKYAIFSSYVGCHLKNMSFRNIKFKDVSFCIYLNAGSTGSIENVVVENCLFEDIFGTSSGTGNGVAIANWRSGDGNIRIINNTFDNCGRHSIYCSHARGVVIDGNTVINHGVIGGSTIPKNAAINIARSEDIIVTNNFVSKCLNDALEVTTDTASGMIHCENILIKGNCFSDGAQYRASVVVGTDDPDTNGYIKDVIVSDNMFIAPDNVNPAAMLLINSGENVRVSGNTFDMSRGSFGYSRAINLYARGTNYPSNNYFVDSNIIINNPQLANSRGIEVDSTVTTGTLSVVILNNFIQAGQKIYNTTTVTNTNYKYADGYCT